MSLISPKRLIVAAVLTFLALFINGLWKIRADNNIFASAGLLLIISQLFIFLTLSYLSYHILGGLLESKKRIFLVSAAVLFIILWFTFLFDGILPPSYYFYVIHGKFLANNYGINWFWMDWGAWVQCVTVYAFGLFLFLMNLILNLIPKTQAKHSKK